MTVSLTALTSEVQARCNALTGSSTATEVMDCAIVAKKVQLAGGAITRTNLDTELQRIINTAGGGSAIEDLILMAASATASANVYLPPIGSFLTFFRGLGSSLAITYVDEYGCTWLSTGVVALATTYPLLAAKSAYKVFEWEVLSSSAGASNFKLWAASGSIHVRIAEVAGSNTINYSTNGGGTWTAKSFSSTTFTPRFLKHDGTNFICIGTDTADNCIKYVTVATASVAGTWAVTTTSIVIGAIAYNTMAIAIGNNGSNYHIVVYEDAASVLLHTYYGAISSLTDKGTHTLSGVVAPNSNWGRMRSSYLAPDSGFYLTNAASNLDGYAWLYSPGANTYTVTAGIGLNSSTSPAYQVPYVYVLGKYLTLVAGGNPLISNTWNGSKSNITVSGLPISKYLGYDGAYVYFLTTNKNIIYTSDWVNWTNRTVTLNGVSLLPMNSSTTNSDPLIEGNNIFIDNNGIVYKLDKSAILSNTPNYCGTVDIVSNGASTSYVRAA